MLEAAWWRPFPRPGAVGPHRGWAEQRLDLIDLRLQRTQLFFELLRGVHSCNGAAAQRFNGRHRGNGGSQTRGPNAVGRQEVGQEEAGIREKQHRGEYKEGKREEGAGAVLHAEYPGPCGSIPRERSVCVGDLLELFVHRPERCTCGCLSLLYLGDLLHVVLDRRIPYVLLVIHGASSGRVVLVWVLLRRWLWRVRCGVWLGGGRGRSSLLGGLCLGPAVHRHQRPVGRRRHEVHSRARSGAHAVLIRRARLFLLEAPEHALLAARLGAKGHALGARRHGCLGGAPLRCRKVGPACT